MLWTLAVAVSLAESPDGEERPGMVGHFEAATYTMLTVAVGDVRAARRHAKELADREGVPMTVRNEADALRRCKKMDCAAETVAAMSQTCAGCHVAGGVGPRPSGVEQLPLLPPQKQHAFAAMYLWIGLVTPHERAFEVGLGGAVPPVSLDSSQALFDQLQTFEDLVAQTTNANDWDERAGAFGQMLQTCAGCHKLAGLDKRIKAEQKASAKEK